MSAGVFVNTFYKSITDATIIAPVRVQPESIAATVSLNGGADVPNTPDAGPATVPTSAEVSGSTRRSGIHTGKVYLSLTGTAPTGYSENSKTSIPTLSQLFFANCRRNAVVTYLGTTWRVTGRRSEKIN